MCSPVVVGIFLLLILKGRFGAQTGLGFLPGNLGREYLGRIFPPALRACCLFSPADHGAGGEVGVEEGGCDPACAAPAPRPRGDQQTAVPALGGSHVCHVPRIQRRDGEPRGESQQQELGTALRPALGMVPKEFQPLQPLAVCGSVTGCSAQGKCALPEGAAWV